MLSEPEQGWGQHNGADKMVPGFVSLILAGAAAVGMGSIVLFGVSRIFRGRKITMADLPELPAPATETSDGSNLQA
jgi:hypothetical protein